MLGSRTSLGSRTHGARLEIADGLLTVWSTTSWTGDATNFDIDAFRASAAAVLGSRATSLEATG
jgi:hypothetical protein